jgi:hypothetical protein
VDTLRRKEKKDISSLQRLPSGEMDMLACREHREAEHMKDSVLTIGDRGMKAINCGMKESMRFRKS